MVSFLSLRRAPGRFCLLALVVLACAVAPAVPFQLEDGAVFAVVVRKAGIAKGLAHDHFIAVRAPKPELEFNPEQPESARFRLVFPAQDLEVDDAALKTAQESRLLELGLLDEAFPDIDAADRAKVRGNMLDKKQLDASAFPEISAELKELSPAKAEGPLGQTHVARILLTAHGVGKEVEVGVRLTTEGGVLQVEGVGTCRFDDLGFPAYRVALGAIRNRDEFSLYLRFRASVPRSEVSR